jgi:signal transduction histidine kinase
MDDASFDELRLEIEELRASRTRVVAAGDADRRRIERDLHDGAQQHLVALAVKLQLARQIIESDPRAAHALLEEMGHDVREALEAVREVAFGIYPALLIARGLTDALTAAASAAGIPTRVETVPPERYPPDVEATVYFCCLEALHNATKYAGSGARATLRAWQEQGTLLFEVVDDGVGFAEPAEPRGAGLANMGDRLGALGGRLTISSAPGRGTRVLGAIPLTP